MTETITGTFTATIPEKSTYTTAEHFEVFKAQVQKELDRFGLKSWSVFIAHEDLNGDCLANVSFNWKSKAATIALNKDWGETEITDHQLRRSAFHEVMELLLAPLYCLGFDAGARQYDLKREDHSIIHTLENVVGYLEG